jgi:hypothetical protein
MKRAREKYKKAIPYNEDATEDDKYEFEGYTLQNLYEFITKTSMPKRHDAQMDVYACATIYFDTCHPKAKDTKALKEVMPKNRFRPDCVRQTDRLLEICASLKKTKFTELIPNPNKQEK